MQPFHPVWIFATIFGTFWNVLDGGSSLAMAEENSLQVMTYNIRFANRGDGEDVWGNRHDSVGKVIQAADIVGLQEVTAPQLRDIEERTKAITWYGVGRDDGKAGGEFSPVGYRTERFEAQEQGTFWLSPTPEQVGSRGWDAALPRIASWMRLKDLQTGETWLVVNTHFDHVGAEARLESAKLIHAKVQQMADGQHVIVMGDLNTAPDSAPLKALTSADQPVVLQDTRVRSQSAPAGPTGTWNGFKAINPNVRIDFILTSPQVTVLAHETLDPKTPNGRFASDHLPVQAKLSVSP